jgi:hypothetical protein
MNRFLGTFLLAASLTANGAIVWDNGNADGNTFRCDTSSAATVCGGDGWTVADDFTLSAATIITGFTYNDFVSSGSELDYLGTNWAIFDGDPFLVAPIFTGSTGGVLSAGDAGSILVTVTGLSINLNAGTYWLAIQTQLDNDGLWTRASAPGAGLPGFKQYSGDGNFNDVSGDTAFTLTDGVTTTPEPAMSMLMGVGLVGLGLMKRFRKSAR